MDESLFARRALGGLGGGGQRRAVSASKPSPKGDGGPRPSPPKKHEQGDEDEPAYQPTPEDVLEMMKLLRDTGLSDAELPPDVPETLEGMMSKVRKQQQQRRSGGSGTGGGSGGIALPSSGAAAAPPLAPPPPPHQNRLRSFVPSAWMVVKTCTTAPCGPPLPEEGPQAPRRRPFPAGRKVFVNVCSSPAVPAPAAWKGGASAATTTTAAAAPGSSSSSSSSLPPSVEAALDRWTAEDDASSESLRFPLSCGPLRHGSDRRGDPCAVADVAFSPRVVRAAERHRPLRAFLVQLSLEWFAQKYALELDVAGFRLPRMAYKAAAGETGIAEQTLALDARDLVREVEGGEGAGKEGAAVSARGRKEEEGAVGKEGDEAGGGGAASAAAAAGAAATTKAAAAAAASRTAAAAATATAAAAAAARTRKPPPPPHQQPPPPPLPFSVSFEGSPATAAVVRVELPPDRLAFPHVRVDVRGAAGCVRVALLLKEEGDEGEEEAAAAAAAADVRLPFSVSAARSSARLAPDGRSVTVRLPWVPVHRVLDEVVAGARAGKEEKNKREGGGAGASLVVPSSSSVSAVVAELE